MSYWSAFARKYPSKALMRIDGGSIFSRGEVASPVINRFVIEGTYRSNLDAVNLSAWDVPAWQEMADMAAAGALSRDFLNLPLVSANLTAKVQNFPAVQRYIVKEQKVSPEGGKLFRVGITGVLVDPEERLSRREFQVQKPVDAARQVVAELNGKADYVILLADMGLGEAISLAVQVPGIHMIVVSHNYIAPTDAQQVGDTLIVSPANEGRMISEVRLNVASGSQRLEIESHLVPLDKSVPDDPALAELLRKAQAEVDKIKK
jgi:2',3'-cyclic-nucleotide 2'-phosphodiesterase (5'-nucleotidase family)